MQESKLETSTAGRLGFGLSSIAGLAFRKEQQRILQTAYDCGISHFDTAPYYGSGDAESILGEFLRDRTIKATITTKYGLQSGALHLGGAYFRNIARRAFRIMPFLKPGIGRTLGALSPTTRNHSIEGMVQSVDSSLQKLRLERIDFFLLHDWSAEKALETDVLGALENLVALGKIGIGGFASSAEEVQYVLNAQASVFGAFQFRHSLTSSGNNLLRNHSSYRLFTHGTFSEAFNLLKKILKIRPGLSERLRQQLGIDLQDERELARMLMCWALNENRMGTILFSTRSPERIAENARMAISPRFDSEVVGKFDRLFRSVMTSSLTFTKTL